MTVREPIRQSLVMRLLNDGIPPSLLIDLLDPEGMKIALAAELTSSDVAQAPAPDLPAKAVRTA